MNILIFGKDGQLGKAFQMLLDSLLPTLAERPNIQYVGRAECNLSDAAKLNSLLNQFHPQLIINASAYTAVDKAETEHDLARRVNAHSVGLLAQLAQSVNAVLVHYSTDYVFDGSGTRPWVEDDETNPLSVFGQT
jgi:dTDP-4-dehydrorhamnose reductase